MRLHKIILSFYLFHLPLFLGIQDNGRIDKVAERDNARAHVY